MSSSGKGEWLQEQLTELLEAGARGDNTRLESIASKLYRVGVILEFIGNHVLVSLEKRKKHDLRPDLRLRGETYAWDIIELMLAGQLKVPPIDWE
jgi:hypothetical protein